MYFCIIVLFLLTAILQLIKFYSFVIFSFLINAIILLLKRLDLIHYLYIHFLSFRCLFSILKHYLELYITDTALKVPRSLFCFTTSNIS